MLNTPLTSCEVTKVNAGEWSDTRDHLATEEPLEIQIEFGKDELRELKSISITMRTPGNDRELALGFLFTEGIIKKNSDVRDVTPVSLNVVRVYLSETIFPDLQRLQRHFYTSSSCGVCGKSSIDAVHTISSDHRIGSDELHVSTTLICQLPRLIQEKQNVFKQTGGLHASALFDAGGELLSIQEDVGRHNALDKLIGVAFDEKRLPLHKNILLLSGRASFELMQKAIMAGIPIVCAVGAPSGLAVQMAKEHSVTLVGFLRGERFNIYAGKERILKHPAPQNVESFDGLSAHH